MTGFKHPALKQLTDQQVRFAPPARRAEQLARAEQLLAEIDSGKRYPYQFVCWRITDFRPDTYPNLLLPGDELAHDLRLMIQTMRLMMQTFAERVAERTEIKALPLPVENAPEPVLTLEEISKKLNVSTKTIRRWRKFGLVGQPIMLGGKRQLGFMQSVVERFLATQGRGSNGAAGSRKCRRTSARTFCGVPGVCRASAAAPSPRSVGASPAAWDGRWRPCGTLSRIMIAKTPHWPCSPT